MGKTFVMVAVLFAALAAATAAWAQEVGVGPPDEVIYSQGNYAVSEDGFLIIDGDVAILCSEVGIDGASPADQPPSGSVSEEAQAQAQRARNEEIRACQAAGFPTATDVSSAALPETGGAPPLLLTGLLLLLAGGGLVALRGTR